MCIIKNWAVKYKLSEENEDYQVKKLTKETYGS